MPPRSAILSLPEQVRAELDRKLIQGGFQDYRGLSAWLSEQGYEIGKSTVHSYGSKFEQKLAALKLATDQAKAYSDTAGDDQAALSESLISMVQVGMFEVLTNLEEATGEKDQEKRLALLGKAAKAAADVGRSSVTVKKHKLEVVAKIRAELEAMKKEGFDGATLDAVQKRVAVYLPDNGR
jgi:hypothetical protein